MLSSMIYGRNIKDLEYRKYLPKIRTRSSDLLYLRPKIDNGRIGLLNDLRICELDAIKICL